MAMRSGLHIHPADGIGTSAQDARMALAGLVAAAGVLDGLTVTGTAGWQYRVAAGHVATSRGITTDGVVVFANDAPLLVDCTPSPGTGARIDIIYAKHNDAEAGDSDNLPVLAVAEGVASGTPNPPDLPEGATELARATVGAGATSTSHANVTISHADRQQAYVRGTQPVAGKRIGEVTQDVPSSTVTVINPGGTGLHYSGGVSGAPSGLTVPAPGWYIVSTGVMFESNSSGARRVYIQVNGTPILRSDAPAISGSHALQLTSQEWLEAGDVVTGAAYQNSGSTLSTVAASGFPYLSVAKMRG